MDSQAQPDGVVYTETIVYAPPEQYAADAPYQLAIVDLADGKRTTVRILGKERTDRAAVGDRVVFAEERDGVLFFRKADGPSSKEPEDAARPLV